MPARSSTSSSPLVARVSAPIAPPSSTSLRSSDSRQPSEGHEDARRHHDPKQGQRQEHLPTQPHQLVVTIAREGRADPKEQEQNERHLGEEPERTRNPIEGRDVDGRKPAAEEEDRDRSALQDHVAVFAQEE